MSQHSPRRVKVGCIPVKPAQATYKPVPSYTFCLSNPFKHEWCRVADRSSFVGSEVTTETDRATPEPVSPDEIEIDMNYEPDPTDLVLSSVPGGELFDPRKHKFSEEELKPQPMIKKAKKVFVPDEQKVCMEAP